MKQAQYVTSRTMNKAKKANSMKPIKLSKSIQCEFLFSGVRLRRPLQPDDSGVEDSGAAAMRCCPTESGETITSDVASSTISHDGNGAPRQVDGASQQVDRHNVGEPSFSNAAATATTTTSACCCSAVAAEAVCCRDAADKNHPEGLPLPLNRSSNCRDSSTSSDVGSHVLPTPKNQFKLINVSRTKKMRPRPTNTTPG